MRWGRVCTRLLAVTRTLAGIREDPEFSRPSPDFFRQLSDVLGQAAVICVRETELLTSSEPDTSRDDRAAVAGEARAGLDALTEVFRRQEGTAAAVGGELLLEVRQLVAELDSV